MVQLVVGVAVGERARRQVVVLLAVAARGRYDVHVVTIAGPRPPVAGTVVGVGRRASWSAAPAPSGRSGGSSPTGSGDTTRPTARSRQITTNDGAKRVCMSLAGRPRSFGPASASGRAGGSRRASGGCGGVAPGRRRPGRSRGSPATRAPRRAPDGRADRGSVRGRRSATRGGGRIGSIGRACRLLRRRPAAARRAARRRSPGGGWGCGRGSRWTRFDEPVREGRGAAGRGRWGRAAAGRAPCRRRSRRGTAPGRRGTRRARGPSE